MFVLPIGTAPAAIRRSTTNALAPGTYANAGHAAVVGVPARSMLSLIANGIPYSGSSGETSRSRASHALIWRHATSEIQAGSEADRARS